MQTGSFEEDFFIDDDTAPTAPTPAASQVSSSFSDDFFVDSDDGPIIPQNSDSVATPEEVGTFKEGLRSAARGAGNFVASLPWLAAQGIRTARGPEALGVSLGQPTSGAGFLVRGIDKVTDFLGSERIDKNLLDLSQTIADATEDTFPRGEAARENFATWDEEGFDINFNVFSDPKWLAGNLPEVGISLAASIVGGAGGARVAQKATGLADDVTARYGAFIGSSIVGGSLEATPVYSELIDEGYTVDQAADTSAVYAVSVGVLNALSVDKILNPAQKGVISRMLINGVVEGGTEFLESPAGAIVENLMLGKEIDWKDVTAQGLNEGVLGFGTGAVAGGVISGSAEASLPGSASTDLLDQQAGNVSRETGIQEAVDFTKDSIIQVPVFRGQKGQRPGLESKLGSLTFSTERAAQVYATEPNKFEDQVEDPKVFAANVRITKPIVNRPDDAYISAEDLAPALGQERAAEVIQNEIDAGEVAPVEGRIPVFRVLDNPEVVEELSAAGFDGAVYDGLGETEGETEYRVFNEDQVLLRKEQGDELDQFAGGALNINAPGDALDDLVGGRSTLRKKTPEELGINADQDAELRQAAKPKAPRSEDIKVDRLSELRDIESTIRDPATKKLIQAEISGLDKKATKPKLSTAQRAKSAKSIDVAKDDLIVAIRKLGGLDVRKSTAGAGSDFAGRLSQLNDRQFGVPGIEQKTGNGLSLANLSERLNDLGFTQSRDEGELYQLLDRASRGEKILSLQGIEDEAFVSELLAREDQSTVPDKPELEGRPVTQKEAAVDSPQIRKQQDAQARLVKVDEFFSLADNKPVGGISKKRFQASVEAHRKHFKNANKNVFLISSNKDLPESLVKRVKRGEVKLNNVKGYFSDGKIYIVGNKIKNEADLQRLLLHENIHGAFREIYGRDMNARLDSLYRRIGGSEGVADIARKNGIDISRYEKLLSTKDKQTQRRVMAEELLTHIGQEPSKDIKRLVKEVVSIVRDYLRKIGFNSLANAIDSGEVELASMLRNARLHLEGKGVKVFPMPEQNRSVEKGKEPDLSGQSESDNAFSLAQMLQSDETKFDKVLRNMQDKFVRLKRVQSNIPITDETNTYQSEEAFHGKVENDLNQLEDQYIQPLADFMATKGLNASTFDVYLIARHAKERNAHIASINENFPDGGSGMTNAEAAKVIDQVESSENAAAYKEAANRVYRMTKLRRDIIVRGGLEDAALVEDWEFKYSNYVPLKGHLNPEKVGTMRVGKGLNITGNESMRALGRSSMPFSPLANVVSDITETIIRNRKNEVGNTFLKMVQSNPDADMWEVFTEDSPELGIVFDKAKDKVIERAKSMRLAKNEYFTTKLDGKQYFIKIHDQLLHRAMGNLGIEEQNVVVRGLSMATRYLSSINTSLNPEFVISNAVRDIQTALINLSAEQDIGKAAGKKLIANMSKGYAPSMRAVYRGMRGKDAQGKYGKEFEKFIKAGAKVGFFDSPNVEQQKKKIENMVRKAQGGVVGNTLKATEKTFEFIADVNSAVENAVRLSVFVSAKDAGISEKKAASIAKNLTVNFNRRGEQSTLMNSLFVFFNASVQGTARFAQAMLVPRKDLVSGKRSLNTAQKAGIAISLSAAALAMFNRSFDEKDEDDRLFYDKIPDYIKERNIVIMKGDEKGGYWKIPLPYGYNVFHQAGTISVDLATGIRSVPDASMVLFKTLAGSFNPIGMSESKDASTALFKSLTPSVAVPFVELELNENFFGGRIYNENFPGQTTPDSSLANRSTGATSIMIAKWLNQATGGNLHVTGGIDISPDSLEHVFEFATGGSGRFINNTAKMGEFLSTGQEIEERKIPFWRKISSEADRFSGMDDYYDRRHMIRQYSNRSEELKGPAKAEWDKNVRDIMAMEPMINTVEKQLRGLRRRRSKIEASDLNKADRQKRVDQIHAKMKTLRDQFNKRFDQRVGRTVN